MTAPEHTDSCAHTCSHTRVSPTLQEVSGNPQTVSSNVAGFDLEEQFGPCRASSPWWPVEILQRSLRFPRLVSLLWLGALVSLVVRAFRHGRIKLASTQPAQERTAACKLP